MNRTLSKLLLCVAAGLALPLGGACTSSTGAPACNDLANCCSNPNFGGGSSSCLETAMSGNLTDAGCGMELAMYQQNGMCPVDSGQTSPVDAGQD